LTDHANDLADRLDAARRATIELVALVEDADLNRSLHPEFSPLRWHLGHVAAFEAEWVLVRGFGEPSLSPAYDHLFDPTRNPKAERVHLPPRSELVAFADRERAAVLDRLRATDPSHDDPLLRDRFVFEMVHEHECQHQEILTFLLQMIDPARKPRPDRWRPAEPGAEPTDRMVDVPAGRYAIGGTGAGFGYDNEFPAHEVEVGAYQIAKSPVTERAYLEFVESGGYRDNGAWGPTARRWKAEHAIEAPRDWSRAADGSWTIRTMFEDRPPLAGHPVVGVSRFEAEAFARWAGRRLPTEAEWEVAASCEPGSSTRRRYPWGDETPSPALANLANRSWGTRPIDGRGRSALGCDDMAGQSWEWTASTFAPYPGFRAFPYDGYSAAWFDGEHAVLRGGSWATRGGLARGSFRNWYHPHVREILAGFRLASTA